MDYQHFDLLTEKRYSRTLFTDNVVSVTQTQITVSVWLGGGQYKLALRKANILGTPRLGREESVSNISEKNI